MLILVVEDDPEIATYVARGLRRAGHEVDTAADGNAGLTKALTAGYEAAVVDLMLPGLDGTEVARKLKSDSRTSHIPVIMLTAKGEETDVVVGLTLGADDYITKPFSMKILLARLSVVLRRSDPPIVPSDSVMLRAGPLSID